eukprot:TRINITY_DN5951_c0_g1_i1.p1 TRINITY_DN5951_c0_g1~~TRINITY_DN5951_c0_g1_i1.p1  ORF type:complete len:229 (+),score=48.30 TRINITY_DN5951_c0_g1_i1:44-730(+)
MSAPSFKEKVRELAKLPQNQKCSDCNERDPDWASTNLGVFFCINCSGIHRRLGVHISKVRSVKLDDWDEEQYQSVARTGNVEGNKHWEATLPAYFLRPDEAPNNTEVRENFIRAKYERKEFIPNAPALSFIKEGYLFKLSPRGSDRWQERWFVLRGTVLAYYGKKGDSNPKKTVDIAGATVRFAEGGKKAGHGIIMSMPNRDYKLWHEDVKIIIQWIHTLRMAKDGGQ